MGAKTRKVVVGEPDWLGNVPVEDRIAFGGPILAGFAFADDVYATRPKVENHAPLNPTNGTPVGCQPANKQGWLESMQYMYPSSGGYGALWKTGLLYCNLLAHTKLCPFRSPASCNTYRQEQRESPHHGKNSCLGRASEDSALAKQCVSTRLIMNVSESICTMGLPPFM